jgi:hypothetical protein
MLDLLAAYQRLRFSQRAFAVFEIFKAFLWVLLLDSGCDQPGMLQVVVHALQTHGSCSCPEFHAAMRTASRSGEVVLALPLTTTGLAFKSCGITVKTTGFAFKNSTSNQ